MDDRRDPIPTEAQVNEEGVDLTLIRWSLSLSALERLRILEGHMDFAAKIQQARSPEAALSRTLERPGAACDPRSRR